jgi:hypothetical protein
MLRVFGLVKHLYWKPLLIGPMEKNLSNKKVGLYRGITSIQYPDTSVVLQVLRDSAEPTEKW